MPIPFPLEWVIDRVRTDPAPRRPDVEPVLAALDVSDADAERVWPEILDHKWYLSERIGRDVGLLVALVDYFDNVAPEARRARRGAARPERGVVAAPVVALERMLGDFVDAVRGPRSLSL
jgi:hypothetical protein